MLVIAVDPLPTFPATIVFAPRSGNGPGSEVSAFTGTAARMPRDEEVQALGDRHVGQLLAAW